jgi:flavodoxin
MASLRKLVIYYSLTGHIRQFSEFISQQIGADLLELQPKQEPPKAGFGKYFWGGKQVYMKEKPALAPLDKNPADYDIIFLGTPIWAWTYTPAFNSFFDQQKLTGKKIALFCSCGSDPGQVFTHFTNQLTGNEIIGQLALKEADSSPEENQQKLADWLKNILP